MTSAFTISTITLILAFTSELANSQSLGNFDNLAKIGARFALCGYSVSYGGSYFTLQKNLSRYSFDLADMDQAVSIGEFVLLTCKKEDDSCVNEEKFSNRKSEPWRHEGNYETILLNCGVRSKATEDQINIYVR